MGRPPDSASNYRPDIDGLRAIAVLAVIVFHLNDGLLPGGFLGVDVFFVISGFLITRNIVHELDRGRFSVIEFYRRRVKRIAPAMLLTVAATLLAGQLLMLPEDARATAKSALFSLLSMANVYFCYYPDTGYFAPDSRQLPLLHLWSLGVEEQFYIIWPWLLLAFYRPARGALFVAVLVAVAALSFFLGDVLYGFAPSFVYYMLPTRAGELLLGAIVAIAAGRSSEPKVSRWWSVALSVAGLLMLLGSLWLLTDNHPYPGWYALPPTLGTAFLILAGQGRRGYIARGLSLPPLVWVGLISYSAYLWHWPLLALYRYGYGDIGAGAALALFALTMVLAWASYRFVELPARRSTASARRVFAWQYVLPAGVLGTLALCAIYPARLGIPVPRPMYRAQLERIRRETRPAFLFASVCQRQRVAPSDLLNDQCVLGAASAVAPRAILWGDSNAAHYIGMISVFAGKAGFRFRNIEIGNCPPLASEPGSIVRANREADCRESLKLTRPVVNSFPVVIAAASWDDYGPDLLPAFFNTAGALAKAGKLVIIIGRTPKIANYDRLCREKALTFPLLRCRLLPVPIPRQTVDVNGKLRAFAERTPHVLYFDATPYLCPSGRCPILDGSGKPRYFDSGHLSMAGSLELGREIVSHEGVPTAFRSIVDWMPAAGAGF